VTITDIDTTESTGANFALDGFMEVRARTRKAVHAIASKVKPAMAEDEAKEIARDVLSSLEMLAPHHRPVRPEHDQRLQGAFRARSGARGQ
jgi:hypothetical protein